MKFKVFSEIAALQHVLVHRPGREIDEMPPSLMNEMLFDDILFGPKTRDEHDRFCKMIRSMGAETHDFQELLSTALASAHDERIELVKLIAMHEALPVDVEQMLIAMPPAKLAETLIAGLLLPESEMQADFIYELTPAPNLFFSRDPQSVIGNKIVFSAMHTNVRKRESVLSQFVFCHHPDFAENQVLCDFSHSSLRRSGHVIGARTIEGGDILVFREGVVLVGVSERTSEQGIDQLVEALRIDGQWRRLIMVMMPRSRAVMHLDTIFTRISEDECLVYGPMIASDESGLSAITIDLHKSQRDFGTRFPSLLGALRHCGIDLKPIFCGGTKSFIQQSREQWTDGANSFALRSGMIIVYSRNTQTLEELDRHGYQLIHEKDFSVGANGEWSYPYDDKNKYALLLQSTELTRARGGPRCMTMPLARA
jgi:arginine deiminase